MKHVAVDSDIFFFSVGQDKKYGLRFSDLWNAASYDSLVSLVERMLALHKQLPQSGTPHEKTALERQIEATDGQIDGGPALWADGGGDQDS